MKMKTKHINKLLKKEIYNIKKKLKRYIIKYKLWIYNT
jgi:hypothetical protein